MLKNIHILLPLGAIFIGCTGGIITHPGVVSKEFIFTKAPFKQCHASTIAETNSGLVAAGLVRRHPRETFRRRHLGLA